MKDIHQKVIQQFSLTGKIQAIVHLPFSIHPLQGILYPFRRYALPSLVHLDDVVVGVQSRHPVGTDALPLFL